MATRTDESIGDLVVQASHQLSDLVRTEVALAKAEITQEVRRVGKGAGLFGGAGAMAWLALVFASLALMFGLGEVMDLWGAALVVTAVYAVVAALFVMAGRSTLGSRR
jgi:hypothetical protein